MSVEFKQIDDAESDSAFYDEEGRLLTRKQCIIRARNNAAVSVMLYPDGMVSVCVAPSDLPDDVPDPRSATVQVKGDEAIELAKFLFNYFLPDGMVMEPLTWIR